MTKMGMWQGTLGSDYSSDAGTMGQNCIFDACFYYRIRKVSGRGGRSDRSCRVVSRVSLQSTKNNAMNGEAMAKNHVRLRNFDGDLAKEKTRQESLGEVQ